MWTFHAPTGIRTHDPKFEQSKAVTLMASGITEIRNVYNEQHSYVENVTELNNVFFPSTWASGSQPVVRVPLGERENNIGNGGKHKKKRS
jgi:hypothetical protein